MGWFESAAGLLTGNAPRRDETFRQTCPCGEVLQAQREPTMQRRSCPVCGTRFLILPISPFPIPRPPRGYKPKTASEKSRRKKDREEADDPETVDAEKGAKDAVPMRDDVTSDDLMSEEQASLPVKTRIPLRQRAGRLFTPLRLMIAAMLLLISVSGYLYWWRTQQQWARENYTTAVARAYEALEQNELDDAAIQFEIASQSAIILELDDLRAAEVQQYHRELAIQQKLSEQSFSELLQYLKTLMVLPVKDQPGPYIKYRGGEWFVLDLWGKVIEEEDGKWLLIEAPITQDKAIFQVKVRLPEQAVTSGPANGQGEQRFLLATRCDRLEPLEESSNWWLLICEDSFLWTHAQTLRPLGMFEEKTEFQAELESLLAMQSTAAAATTKPVATEGEE
ncbi:hypothetical protein Pla110_04630 [Polystyrenella longa]|uniref:Uncharacterized protein n=1 Tax=Polystyrenella longa TaxID=2528007 RepID=A0A518CHQ2_9PLAN|nr:hypothetical protein [Polystyrenella longa]QDU78759.1 hypothetical protein Pla110_04630 [Polystyrenella longa]